MGRVAETGDGSTLSLDFTTMGGTIDSRITFSRADATPLATFINSLGYVETVATAQAPRFDFVGGVAKGLLIEAPATNLIRRSQEFSNSAWDTYNITSRTDNAATGPDNLTSATRVVLAGQYAIVYQGVSTTAGVTYTFSFWAKRESGNTAFVIHHNFSATGSNTAFTMTDNWQRYEVSVLGRTGGGFVEWGVQDRNVSGQGTILLWGAQLEVSPVSTSYIKTTTIAVTRAVDTAIIAAGSNFSSWYTGGTTGTFVSNWYGNASSSTARSVIATSDQTTKHLHMYQTASALTLRLADFNAAATVTTANSLTAGALTKGAFSYNGTATSLCLNGGTVATGTLAFSVAPTWLSIGGPSTNGTSITDTTVMLNNSIRTLKYFPARLSDGQIQGLTT